MLALFFLTLLTGAFATVDNSADNAFYTANGAQIPYGYYNITAVGSGNSLTYTSNKLSGQSIFPAPGVGSPIELQPHNASTPWVRMRPNLSTKCISSQWNYTFCGGNGCDWAGALYECAVDPVPPGTTVASTKQFYIFYPLGTSPETYNIITTNHLPDMATRALQDCSRGTLGNAQSVCIDELDPNDNTFVWMITPSFGPSNTTGAAAVQVPNIVTTASVMRPTTLATSSKAKTTKKATTTKKTTAKAKKTTSTPKAKAEKKTTTPKKAKKTTTTHETSKKTTKRDKMKRTQKAEAHGNHKLRL